ncbi:MAG: hypothetical protein M1376_16890 [Planctomycetes bacterium]|nr:hypothetical protein [Planctomycetota bacterium]
MRRIAGNVLIGLAVLGAAGTILLAGASLVEMHRTYPTSDRYAAAEGGFLLAGAVLGLEGILFLTGRHLRQPRPERGPAAPGARRRGRVWLLALYLGGSMGIGLLAGLGHRVLLTLGPPAFLIYQPTFLVQILLGGVLGPSLEGRPGWQMILVATNLLYFVAFLYPIYSIMVMDRAVEAARYRRMKTILALFVSVHVLLGLALAAILRA